MELPKHILKSLHNGQISVGSECFPPDEEEKYIVRLLNGYFEGISEHLGLTEEEAKSRLVKALKECIQIESEGSNRDYLEQVCADALTKWFQFPDNTLVIDLHIVNKVNTKDTRILPEPSGGMSFDSISDLEELTNEIYRRRMLNALIAGASWHYGTNLLQVSEQICSVNPKLIGLYYEISDLNNFLMFLRKDVMPKDGDGTDGGNVNVYINENGKARIQADGVVMVALMIESIKGVLELAISHGLPKDKLKASYVISKADFKLAEQWDHRLGVPMWAKFMDNFENIGVGASETGLAHIFMALSQMPYDLFKEFMKEVLAGTKRGLAMLEELCNQITYKRGHEEFNNYVDNQQVVTDDDEYYGAEELIQDSTDAF
ncbi:MAG: hypothetical protein LUD72_02685 [Bacteroidales bacterium]|nr:hypothetical protein [Bacteroidales bacterium]